MTSTRQVFDDFNVSVADFLRHANRTTMKASLFDALRRTEVTLPAYSSLVPAFFRSIAAQVSPEDLGRAMRRPAARPNPMHIAGAPWQCLLERERRMLLGLPAQPAGDLDWVLEFSGRALEAARGDGSTFPCARTGWHMRILNEKSVGSLTHAATKLSEEERVPLRRLCASLELYSFMLHGEHRDGFFEHGPYPLDDGSLAVVKDYTDLQSDFLPWSTPDVRLPYPAVSVVLVLDAACSPSFNWAGTMTYEGELYEHLRRAVVYSIDAHGRLAKLEPASWTVLERASRDAQKKLFTVAAGWPAEQKIKYGQWLFANHLQEIPKFLGLDPRISSDMVAAFTPMVDSAYRELDMQTMSPLWGALRRPQPFSALERAE